MRAKQKQLHSKKRQPGGSPSAAASGTGRASIQKQVVILAVVTGIVAAGWFAVSHWRSPGKPYELVASPPNIREASTNSRAPRASANGNNSPEFVSQVNRGNELLAQGKAAEAVEVFKEAMRLNPKDDDVHYNLGLALARLGKYEESIQQYQEALRIFPNYAEAHNNLGNVLMRLDRNDEAIQHFEQAVKIMPDYASAHNNLGTAMQKVGRTQDAFGHFREAVKLNPDYWQAHFNLGTSCLRLGQLSEARSEFEAVLRQQPDFGPAKSALEKLPAQPTGTAK
jgi:tetratricopeptide (TPR) repeat protein